MKSSYEVIRAHEGDKPYKVGDTREANPSDVAHLVGKCLVLKAEKKAKPVSNKAAPKVKNKAAK